MGAEATVALVFRQYRRHFALTILLIVALYWNIIGEMILQWTNDQNYSHGFLIPFISTYFLYGKRDELAAAKVQPGNIGVFVIFFAFLVFIAGNAAIEYYSMRVSLVILLGGLVLHLFGWSVSRITAMPLLYLLFMVPLPYIIYDAVSFPLKLFVAKYSVMSLKMMGFAVIREGNIIMFPEIVLEVADACSGLRSLISLLAMSVALAFVTQTRAFARWIVALSAFPIAIATNFVRVVVTGVLSHYYGAAVATGFFHEFAGLSVFVIALLFLGLVVLVVKRWA